MVGYWAGLHGGPGAQVACRIFCTSVSETTALLALHPDGVTEAQKSAALAVDIPAMNGV